MAPSRVRRAALPAVLGLLAALLPLAGASGPAHASATCTNERQLLRCDDENPPVTANANGTQTGTGRVTVTATASYTDADTDPVGFECQLTGTSIWGPCAMSDLAAGSQKIAIRAVDTADAAKSVPCDRVPQCLLGGPEVPDYDATPEVVTVNVTGGGGGGGGLPLPSGPNGAPETQISGGPSDRITPGAPVSLARKVTVTLASSEPATFRCALNARKVACKAGVNVLKHFRAGPQVLVAQAVDRDGKFDATPASLSFYVPINVSAGRDKGWQNVKSKTSYAHDYVVTRHQGAILTLGDVSGIRELRLLAPTGPGLGKLAIRVGNSRWYKVRLGAKKIQHLKGFELRDEDSRPLSGAMQIKALKVPKGGAVAVDAVVAR